MDISVVVPFHNEEQHIEECITGLLAQNYSESRFEVIMVDSNSTDSSVEIAKQYPRIKLLSEQRPGPYSARNRGVSAAKGEIIAFTDADCVPSTDWLQQITDAMSSSQVLIVQGNLRFASDSGSLALLADYESEKSAYVFSSQAKELYYGSAGNMGVRRVLFETLGPFQELMRGADVILVHRALEKYSSDAMDYCHTMRVRHLEIASFWDYYCKQLVYGKSYRTYRRVASAAVPLTNTQRIDIFKRTIRKNRYRLARSAYLLLLLASGSAFYEFGRFRPIFASRRPGAI